MSEGLLEHADRLWAEYLWTKWQSDEWKELSDEEQTYLLEHLVSHLERIGWSEKVHALLHEERVEQINQSSTGPLGGLINWSQWRRKKGAERRVNTWFGTKERAKDIASYLEDVQQAREMVEGERTGKAIGLQCRYALMEASMRSWIHITPPYLPAALVRAGSWTLDQALAYARQSPSSEHRHHILIGLSLTDELANYHEEFDREMRETTVPETEQDIEIIDEDDFNILFSEHADAYFAQILSAVQLLPEIPLAWNERTKAWLGLTHALVPHRRLMKCVDLIVADILSLYDGSNDTEKELYPAVLQDDLRDLFDWLIPILARHPYLLAQAMASWGLSRPRQLARMGLGGMYNSLVLNSGPRILERFLNACQEIRDKNECAQMLASLIPYLPEPRRTQELIETLSNTRKMPATTGPKAGGGLWRVLCSLVNSELTYRPHLQPTGLAGRYDLLVPVLSSRPRLLLKVWKAAMRIDDRRARAAALVSLARMIPEACGHEIGGNSLLTAIKAVLEDVKESRDFVQLLANLVLILDDYPDLRAMVHVWVQYHSKYIKNGQILLEMLENALLPTSYYYEPTRTSYITQALAMTQHEEDLDLQTKAFAQCVPHLPEPERSQVLAHILNLTQKTSNAADHSLAEIIWRLIRHLPRSKQSHILAEALADALARLITRLPDTERSQLLAQPLAVDPEIGQEAIRARDAERYKLMKLSTINEITTEDLTIAQQAADPLTRTAAILHILPHNWQLRQPKVLDQALASAYRIREPNTRASILSDLAQYLCKLPADELYPLWCRTLPKLTNKTRADLFRDLAALSPVIASLGGDEAVTEVFQAVQDVEQWWP